LAFMSNAEFPFHTFCTCCLLFALGVQRLYSYIAIEPYSSASVFVHRLCVCVRVSVCDVHICVHLYAGLFEYFITCWLNFHRILSVLFGYVLFSAPPLRPKVPKCLCLWLRLVRQLFSRNSLSCKMFVIKQFFVAFPRLAPFFPAPFH